MTTPLDEILQVARTNSVLLEATASTDFSRSMLDLMDDARRDDVDLHDPAIRRAVAYGVVTAGEPSDPTAQTMLWLIDGISREIEGGTA